MSNAAQTETSRTLQEGDVVLQTKGRKPGRIGIVKWSTVKFENYKAEGQKAYRMEWAKRRTRSKDLPRVTDDFSGTDMLAYVPGPSIRSTAKVSTLRRYGLRRIPVDLLKEWRSRLVDLEAQELTQEMTWGEYHDAVEALREEMIERTEPVEVG